MSLSEIEADAVRREQTDIWNTVSVGWTRWRDRFEDGAEVVSRRLVELAGIGPGDRVLDFGTGLGQTALTAAAHTGPRGRVRGIDLASVMIENAAEAADGVPGVEFAVGSLEVADPPAGGYDAVISRWALPFAGDRAATLSGLAGMLRPGGVLAAAVWAEPSQVPMISLGFSTIARFAGTAPPPPGPGPFALADPDQLAEEVAAAGFADVSVERVVVPFRLGSAGAYARFTAEVLPPGMRRVVIDCPVDSRAELWRAVTAAAENFREDDGSVALPSLTWCVRGRR